MSEMQQILSRQVNRWDKERKDVENLIRTSKVESATRPADVRPVVTLSRQRGCRGRELAKLLAHDLHYGMLDQALISYIGEHMGVRSELVEMLDEHEKSELEMWVQSIFSGDVFNHDDYIKGLGEAVKSSALHGGVVILGRGANYFLRESQVYRVRLAAPMPIRIRNLVDTEGMTKEQAAKEIAQVDKERAKFVKRYFNKDIDAPEDYDLFVNTGTHTMDGVVKTIISALRAKGWPFELTGGDMRSRRPVAV